MLSRNIWSLIAVTCTFACAGQTAVGSGGAVDRVRDHVYFLASDAMRGRASGSPEYERAARYVASRLEELGLEPLFAGSYRQPFELERQVFGRRGRVELTRPDGAHRFDVMKDALFMNAGPADGRLGPFEMVYVGLGIHQPEVGWDDFAGLDLEGKCALLVVDTPRGLAAGLPAGVFATYADLSRGPNLKARAAAAHGADCLLGIPSPTPPSALVSTLDDPEMLVQRGAVDPRRSDADLPVAAVLSARATTRLFDGQPADPFPGGRPRGFVLDGSVRFIPDLELRERQTTANVGAWLPGSDPTLAREVIVLSAHIDGQGMRGRIVLNSANDNASSVAALLEAAGLLAGKPVRRSVAFLFTAAEEDGLLGARIFVENPPFELAQIELAVNMEMIGKPVRSSRRHRFRVTGRISRQVDHLAETVEAKADGVRFDYAFRSDDDGDRPFRNADHVQFFLRGIPTLYFYGGGEDYHQPSDDPERINYPKVAKMAEILVTLVQTSDGWSASP